MSVDDNTEKCIQHGVLYVGYSLRIFAFYDILMVSYVSLEKHTHEESHF